MKCTKCGKNEAISDRDVCMDCLLDSLAEEKKPEKYYCPNCKKETKKVFEYSTQDYDHRKIYNSMNDFFYQDFDIIKEYYTCLECNKQFVVTTEQERK